MAVVSKPNTNIPFCYFCKNYGKAMSVEASIGTLNCYDEYWRVSFFCEQSNCPMKDKCKRVKPEKYLRSEVKTIPELMKRIKNEP